MKVPEFQHINVLSSVDWPLEDFDDRGTGDWAIKEQGSRHGSRSPRSSTPSN